MYSTKKAKAAAARRCRSRISASKAAGKPVLAGPGEETIPAGILACASAAHTPVFSANANDLLSLLGEASALTVAVPLGSSTRFPILSQSPPGPGALKLLFTFGVILPQGLFVVNQRKHWGVDKMENEHLWERTALNFCFSTPFSWLFMPVFAYVCRRLNRSDYDCLRMYPVSVPVSVSVTVPVSVTVFYFKKFFWQPGAEAFSRHIELSTFSARNRQASN